MRELANADVNKAFWKNLLDVNSKSHKCHGCDRHIPATDAKQFETYVSFWYTPVIYLSGG